MAPSNSGDYPEKAGLTRVSTISVIDRTMAGSFNYSILERRCIEENYL